MKQLKFDIMFDLHFRSLTDNGFK